ncbi:isoprenyl transferase [uncultured Fusobacterium sp.]|uniref:isoprenyl transferase n=1 Tax=uncultured Fusobacterium sp. TaxID=159267 RepID=UPI0025D93D5D|nr:isoprenyl transferase [uncultured Fusobacterium sp.]
MEKQVPNHIAIIMDGNGRWAKKRGLPRTFGHKEGAAALRKIITHAAKLGIKYLTVYAFSTENWKRSQEEVSALMFLFKSYIKNEEKNIMENNIRFMVSGRRENVSESLLEAIDKLQEKSKNNSGLTFNIAFNYGGRAEIIDAVNKILKSGKTSIDEVEFSKYLYNDIPDPELLIRTSGELRISNFLLWQIAYSEIYITDTLWPDFDEKELDKAIESYEKRDRRFGGVK